MDLWKDNPVEADARWKGKVVDVEMSLNDLEIKTRADGLAFLLTEDAVLAGRGHPTFRLRVLGEEPQAVRRSTQARGGRRYPG
jgi:hypothetical protein